MTSTGRPDALTLAGCSYDNPASPEPQEADLELVVVENDSTNFDTNDMLSQFGLPQAVVEISEPANGSVSVGTDGNYTYTPKPGFTGTDTFTYKTTDAVETFPITAPPLGDVGGVEIVGSAYGSAWTAVPGLPDVERQFYGLTDRGPNVDGVDENEKVEPIPTFTPAIGRFELQSVAGQLLQTIPLLAADGSPLNGQVSPQADTGESIVDIDGNPLPPSNNGHDPEGLVALMDGTFWVSDEYGPYITHFGADGRAIERLSPYDGTLPGELRMRTANQGMEGLTITPDGKTLVGIMQSALKTPGLDGSAKAVPFARIVTVDLATRKTAEVVYPMDNPKDTKVANSEINALTDTTFVVDERDGETAPAGR